MSEEKKKQIWRGVRMALVILFAGVCALLCRGLFWMLTTWNNLTVDEIIFHLKAPLSGTDANIIWGFILTCLLPALLVMAVAGGLLFWFRRDRRKYRIAAASVCGVGLLAAAVGVINVWVKLDLTDYIKKQTTFSTFIEDHYVDPDDVEITFPRKKRNLIYIYLESMEVTYADKENGGAFEENFIPNLTALAQQNEDFSGRRSALNGGTALYNTTWTVAAMFAQSSGLPLTIPLVDHNLMSTQEDFFPSVVNMGDILQREGYRNVFLLGSDIEFGGRKLLFTQHGDYTIYDYNYSKEQGEIPENYYVFWGYEDAKLFENAKKHLTELAEGSQPFNFTMLTVDTHFEDGYYCADCLAPHGDNRYGNVIDCSDRKVTEFIRWVQQQPFYDNTTIVVMGDHPTMDIDFCNSVDNAYQRKVYTAYINSAVEPEKTTAREYSTFDAFPTTLAALGAQIQGDRLGLGTNLFSREETLLETYGLEQVETELSIRSRFMDDLAGDLDTFKAYEEKQKELEELAEEKKNTVTGTVTCDGYDSREGTFTVTLTDLKSRHEISGINACFWSARNGSDRKWYAMEEQKDGTYAVTINTGGPPKDTGKYYLHIYAHDGEDDKDRAVAVIELSSMEELPRTFSPQDEK